MVPILHLVGQLENNVGVSVDKNITNIVMYHSIPYQLHHTIPYYITHYTTPYYTKLHHHTVSYNTPHYNIPYHTIPCRIKIQHTTLPHCTMPYHTTPCRHNTPPYHSIQHTTLHNTIPYYTIPYHKTPHTSIPYCILHTPHHTTPNYTVPYAHHATRSLTFTRPSTF